MLLSESCPMDWIVHVITSCFFISSVCWCCICSAGCMLLWLLPAFGSCVCFTGKLKTVKQIFFHACSIHNFHFFSFMEYEVEHSRPRGRPKRTWRKVVQKDCQAYKLNREDVVDHSRWRKQIKDGC